MPIFCICSVNTSESMAAITASSAASAVPLVIIGLRVCDKILPSLSSTMPTATFVPPISTPSTRPLSFGSGFIALAPPLLSSPGLPSLS